MKERPILFSAPMVRTILKDLQFARLGEAPSMAEGAPTLATGTAAQESAPAELPIKTWQERVKGKLHERIAAALTDKELSMIGSDEMLSEIADLRAAIAAAPASHQPVAKVLTQEQAWKVISKALGYSGSHRGRTMLIEFLEEAEAIADAILAAASTPTTLTEKKE